MRRGDRPGTEGSARMMGPGTGREAGVDGLLVLGEAWEDEKEWWRSMFLTPPIQNCAIVFGIVLGVIKGVDAGGSMGDKATG